MICFSLSIIKPVKWFFGNMVSIRFDSSVVLEMFKDFKASACFFVCFTEAFPKGEDVD